MEKLTKPSINKLKTFVRLKHGNLKRASDIIGVSSNTLRQIINGYSPSLDIKEKVISNLKNLN